MALPTPVFPRPPEDYAPRDPPTGCVKHAQPGVEAFRDFVLAHLGGGPGSIVRPCSRGSASHHHEGRAWDWSVDAADPLDRQRVDTLLSWLFAADEQGNSHAMLRRAGLDYVIWDASIWNARERLWTPYDGYDEGGRCVATGGCRHAHRDHVHFSFGWPGARAETSLYEWLGIGPDEPAPLDEPASDQPGGEPALGARAVLVGLSGLVSGYWLMRTAMRASTGVGKRSAARRV